MSSTPRSFSKGLPLWMVIASTSAHSPRSRRREPASKRSRKSVNGSILSWPFNPNAPTIRPTRTGLVGDDFDVGSLSRFCGYGADDTPDGRDHAATLADDLAYIVGVDSHMKVPRTLFGLFFFDLDRVGVFHHRADEVFNKRSVSHSALVATGSAEGASAAGVSTGEESAGEASEPGASTEEATDVAAVRLSRKR